MKNSKILGIVLLVVVLGIGGWFLITKQSQNGADLTQKDIEVKKDKQQEQQAVKQNKEAQNNEQKVEELPITDDIDTLGWKEYCNEGYRFCLKYPRDWKVKKNKQDNISIVVNSPQNEKKIQKIKDMSRKQNDVYGEGYMDDLYIYYYDNKQGYFNNIQNASNYSLEKLISTQIDTKFLGKLCFNEVCNFYDCIQYGFSSYYVIFAENNNHLYRIMFGNVRSRDELSQIHKNILQSFRFTK